jgi:hypothetical protein
VAPLVRVSIWGSLMAKLEYGDKVTYITPNGTRQEKAIFQCDNPDGTAQLTYSDGYHVIVAPRASRQPGNRFGSYRPGWADD